MSAFFKTFFFCLVISLAFLGYKILGGDSYNKDLTISKNSSVFGVHPSNKDDKVQDTQTTPIEQQEKPQKEKPQVQNQNKKYDHICYFYSQGGKLTKVKRELIMTPSVEHAVTILLKGPSIAEAKSGMFSEIPSGVDLIDIKKDKNSIIINLTSNFGNGGGTQSVNNRVAQLSKTVKYLEPNKKIYLYIDGKEVEYLGGDGVYIKQPLD